MSGVYHTGELTVQKMAGVELVAQQNGAGIRPTIFKGAKVFLRMRTIIIASSVDRRGRVWSSFLTGEPGFIDVQDEFSVTISSSPVPSDPLLDNLPSCPEIGLLAIDFDRRIRMRINGKGAFDSEGRLTVTTEQVYGNCPKYIQRRSPSTASGFHRTQHSVSRDSSLSPDQQQWIRQADTLFIGSASREGKADVSHRGGPTGFVAVVDGNTLLFPDYFGNSMFNTLGNIHVNPNTGLLFIDFDSGDSLQLTGRSTILWDEEDIKHFAGAERLVRFEIDEALFTENGSPIRWDLLGFSPANPTLHHTN